MNVKIFGVLLMIGWSVSVSAQELKVDLSGEWDLNRCLNYALENNIQLKQSHLAAQTADANILQARGQRLPYLSGSVSQSATNSRNYNDLGEREGWGLAYGGSMSLNTGLTIYGGGQANNDIKRSRLSKEATLLTIDQTEMDLSMSVVQAYLNILYAQENLAYYNEVAATSLKQLERTQKLLEAGSVSKRDLLDMEAQLASDNYSRVTAESNLVQRNTELKQLLEIPVEASFKVFIPEEPVTGIMMALPERYDVTLSVPIFSNYATKASVSRSHINIKQAELVVVNTRNKLLQEVERIYEDTYAGQQRYLAALIQERAAEESFLLAGEQYHLGMLSSIELLQTRNNWLNASRELIQARYNTLLYRKILDYYMGVPLEL
ncbi:MAG: TolC family protein [Bacteroidales bacterium]|nr:TolC family protein [Bacteroidales bacterium]